MNRGRGGRGGETSSANRPGNRPKPLSQPAGRGGNLPVLPPASAQPSAADNVTLSDDGDDTNCVCPTCSELVGDTGIFCDNCQRWLHLSCEGLTQPQYELLSTISRSIWCCTNCPRDVLLSGLRQVKSLQQQVEHLTETMAKQNTDTMSAIQGLTDTVNKLIAGTLAPPTAAANPADLQAEMREAIQRENKAMNLVIVGLPETDTTTLRSDADRAVIEQVLSHLNVPTSDVADVFRDGAVRRPDPTAADTRPYSRIVKVKFTNMNSRIKFLTNFRQQKPGETRYSRTYVRPDLTFRQREADKLLRNELMLRREAEPTADLIIRRGKIIHRSGSRNAAAGDTGETA